MQTLTLCAWATKKYDEIEKILKKDPDAEPYVDFYDPCEGCLRRKGGYNDCPAGL